MEKQDTFRSCHILYIKIRYVLSSNDNEFILAVIL